MSDPLDRPQVATAQLSAGKARLRIGARVTPVGLLAIGGLVSLILLSVVPIVRAAGRAQRDAG